MPINGRKPFTEMFEMAQNELVREGASGQESKYKGLVNNIYTTELPTLVPEHLFKKSGFVKTVADYTTGTVSVYPGYNTVIGSSTLWLPTITVATAEYATTDRTVLLMHFNGADASTTFTDVVGHSVTTSGSVQIDTAQSVFGGASCLFDGDDALFVADSTAWDFGSLNFSIDARVRLDGTIGGEVGIVSNWNAFSNKRAWFFGLSSTDLRFYYARWGWDGQIITVPWTASTGTWYHLAVVRDNNDLHFFVDGAQQGDTQSIPCAIMDSTGQSIGIACKRNDAAQSGPASFLTGWIDELRIIKGASAWDIWNVNDMYLKSNNNNQSYRMSVSDTSTLSFKNGALWTGTSGSGLSYTLFQDRCPLPSDFSSMCKDNAEDPNVVFRYVNNSKIFLDPYQNEEYDRIFSSTVGTSYAYTVKWDGGIPYIHIQANADSAENIGFSYLPTFVGLSEYTTGTATVTSGTDMTVTAGTSKWLTSINTVDNVYYFRNDADGTGSSSLWHKVKTVIGNSSLSLESPFTGTTGTGQAYTISAISRFPPMYDDYIIYQVAALADTDRNTAAKWADMAGRAIGQNIGSSSKRNTQSQFKDYPGARRDR